MKRLLLLAAVIVAFVQAQKVSGATGDVVGGEVLTNGWVLRLAISGYDTNGQFSFGWQTNNTGTPKLSLSVLSQGFTTNGDATTRTRTLYGTKQLRFPYGTNGQSTANYISAMTNVSGTLFIDIALTEYVYSGDSNLVGTIASGLYSNNAANASFTVTNSSLQTYPKVVGKFNEANWQRVTNNSMKLRLSAFHAYAQQYSPVACVQVWSQDAHNLFVTNKVTSMSIDSNTNDALPIVEYITTINVSTLTQGDIVTNNFKAYPWIGDASSVLDTSDGVWGIQFPYYHPLYFKLDQTNLYGTVTAYVNGTNGTANGVAITTNLDTGNLPAAFASISQAAAAIAKTNALLYGGLSRSNCAGGIIVIRGTNAFSGTSGSPPSTRGDTWLTIKSYPGEQAVIINGTGSGNINGLMKLENIRLNSASDGSDPRFVFASVSNLWFLNCTFAVTNSTNDFIDGIGNHWVEGGTVIAMDQGLSQQGSQVTVFEMIRGVRFGDPTGYSLCPAVHCYNFIGNLKNATNRTANWIGTSISGMPRSSQYMVVGFNKFLRLDYYSSTFASFYSSSVNCSNGAAIVQNLWESVNTNSGDGLLLIHGDGAQTTMTNLMYWQNTTAGAKASSFYDDLGTAPHWVVNCSFYGNLHSDFNIKSDTFSGNSLDGRRTGNWAILYGVLCRGSGHMEYGAGAPGNFLQEFAGLGSYQPPLNGVQPPQNGATNNFGYAGYINDLSWNGVDTAIPPGQGDYRLQPNSPILMVTNNVQSIPYDLLGKPRSRNVAGAFERQLVNYMIGTNKNYYVPNAKTNTFIP